jgi:hypothetical protein
MATTNTDTQKVEQSTAEKAREEAARVGDVAREEVGQLVEEAKDQGRGLLSETSERLKGEAQHQSQRVAENLRTLSSDLRTMANSADGSGTAATWVRIGADRFDGFAERLEQRGLDGVMEDVGNFARRTPMTFLALTFGAGLIAGRAIKHMDTGQLTGTRNSVSQVGSGQSAYDRSVERGSSAGQLPL